MSSASTDRDRFPVVAHVLLLRGLGGKTEVFLLERAGTGFMDGFHVPPGGHQQMGESVEDAARRECAEETAAVPATLTPVCVLPYRSGRHQGINVVFEGGALSAQPRLGEPESSLAAAWHRLTELPAPLAPWVRDVFELRDRGEWYRELFWP
jgi:8-oxo-dGTP diphosphatase